MIILLLILFIPLTGIAILAAIFISRKYQKERRKNRQIVQYNQEQEKKNQELSAQAAEIQKEIDRLSSTYQDKLAALDRITSSINNSAAAQEEILQSRKQDKLAEMEFIFHQKEEELNNLYQQKQSDLEAQMEKALIDYKFIQTKVKDLEDKQQAYINSKLREEEMSKQKDFYRLVLSETDQKDITFLRSIQGQLTHKEAIDKVIWDVYYKPAYNTLITHLFKDGDRITGIYRITGLTSQQSYIGQSVNIADRIKQHIRSAIDCAPATNILYQEMKKYGPDDFTFEVLEIVPREKLNEREVYWIDFYKTKDFGMNKTKGGS